MRLALHELIRDVREAYQAYEFHRASRLIYEFCTVQASAIYMAAVKDRLYCDLADSPRRRATQTVLHEMLLALVKLLAPILPHTAEEAWQHVPHRDSDEPDSVHLALLPEVDEHALAVAESADSVWAASMKFEADALEPSPLMVWQRLLDLRAEGLVKLEALRNAGPEAPGNPLDTEAVFTVAPDDRGGQAFLQTYLAELEDLLGVGFARVEQAPRAADAPAIAVRVEDSRGKYKRCARCWKRRPDVGSDPEYPDLSARDAAALRALRGA
jgi:isoleucyl-tRNA synthetase